ncbi:hypothetical protein EHQ42_10645 [Leptospira levettii]|uniref:hypothetical protein n=1 Tax=Leptospira levettii TaxID=2023178 RepID=UPI001082782F|nr:hypothetical protein [Leptospira levettii]TGL16857.1 hypothetical protein EHQ42_10645 [Leptospira levettii]
MNENYNFIISIFGALAWIPHLWGYIQKKFIRSKIQIFPNKEIVLGYTQDGPVISLSIAILCESKNILIKNISVTLIHESMQRTDFSWEMIEEELMDLSIPGAGSLNNSRNNQAIVLRIDQDDLIERRYWFNSSKYISGYGKILYSFRESYLNHINSNNNQDLKQLKSSIEYNNLLEFSKNEFSWKGGKYSGIIRIRAADEQEFTHDLEFFLTKIDQKELEQNILIFKDYIEQEYFDRSISIKEWIWTQIKRNEVDLK